MVIGKMALASASAASTGFLPIRSDKAPTNGVTRMTTTAAAVDSHSAAFSLSAPAVVRKAGT